MNSNTHVCNAARPRLSVSLSLTSTALESASTPAMTLDQYVSLSWSKACLIIVCQLSDRNETVLASFFIQEIVCLLHVAILHLLSTFSPQRSANQTFQDQSETTEVLEGMTLAQASPVTIVDRRVSFTRPTFRTWNSICASRSPGTNSGGTPER